MLYVLKVLQIMLSKVTGELLLGVHRKEFKVTTERIPFDSHLVLCG
jgi:hypothetical protein